MVIHRTPGAHTPPKFVLNFRWFLDVILPGGMSRCCLQTWDLNRRPEPYFIWDTCSLRTWRKWRIFGQQKFESENPHQIRLVTSHILPILTTPFDAQRIPTPLAIELLRNDFLQTLIGSPGTCWWAAVTAWCSRWLHICWISWRFVYVIWFGDQGLCEDLSLRSTLAAEDGLPLITGKIYQWPIFVHFWVF